jgi:integrase
VVVHANYYNEIAYLIRGLRLARKAGLLEKVPELEKLPVSNARTGFVNEDQMERIAAELAPHLAEFTRFAYHTGWRRSEIARLEWSEIDWEDEWIDLKPQNAKNKKGRRFPIQGKVKEILQRQWEIHCGSFVFHRPGSERPIRKFCAQFRLAACKARLDQIVLHDMRRSFVRNAVRAGVGVKTAMELSGHKTLSIFMRYNIVDERDLIDAITKMTRRSS